MDRWTPGNGAPDSARGTGWLRGTRPADVCWEALTFDGDFTAAGYVELQAP